MKRTIGHLFIDDGWPEAAEYETNYVSYNPADPESYNRIVESANEMRAGSRLSDTMVFRSIPLDSIAPKRLPRSYRRRRLPMQISRIRNTLRRMAML